MIGQEAMAQRAISNGDSWMTAFIRDRWDCVPGSLEFDRLRSFVRRCLQVALADVGTGDALQKPGQGIQRGGSRTKVVNPPGARSNAKFDAAEQTNTDAGAGIRAASVVVGPHKRLSGPSADDDDYGRGKVDD